MGREEEAQSRREAKGREKETGRRAMRPGSCRCTGSSFNNKNTATQIDSDYSITRTEPTGVRLSATPPVGQDMGLFHSTNQDTMETNSIDLRLVF